MAFPAGQSDLVTATGVEPSTAVHAPEEIVCHCLRVTASAIQLAIAVDGCRTLREVTGATEAGQGCTACHRRIDELLGVPELR